MIALLAALSLAADWEYRQGFGFVNTSTMERKSPEEFLKHARGLRDAGRYPEASNAYSLILQHVADPALREGAHYERAETHLKAGLNFEAYHDFEQFLLRFPQSDRTTAAKRREMEAALAMARHGHRDRVLGIPLISTTRTGIDSLRDALRRYPREDFSAEFYQHLGMLFYERGDFDTAEVEFTTVLEQYPDSPMFVPALYMLGRARENRFDAVSYDVKPLRDAKRHYERFVEEADSMRRLTGPARDWVDAYLETVRQRIAGINERLADKELRTADYYAWKGYPRSAAVFYRSIARYYPATPAAEKARRKLREMGEAVPAPPAAASKPAGTPR